MKAVIMAAGKGTRMLPLTEKVPKVLVSVAGRPFLYYLLKRLEEAGFNEFGLIVGYKKDQVEAFVKEFGYNAKILEQKEQLGTADAISYAEKFVDNENFVLLGGDSLWSVPDLKNFKIDDNLNYIAGQKVDNPSKYGVLVTEEDKLIRIYEKPQEFVGNLVNTGLYKFTPEIFEKAKKVQKSARGEYEIVDAITMLAEEGKVRVISLKSECMDMGCLEDIPKVEQYLKRVEVTI